MAKLFADRYEILSVIGRGGMGIVYRARQVALDKLVALKVLGTSRVVDAHARFEREARAIARLDHPGCVRILDYGRAPQRYIAMEMLEGPTLARALAEGSLSTPRAVHVARQLLLALAHAHGHAVLHRDVKPENVVLPGARAVLIDFGLAALRDEPAMSRVGECLGSPSYIAPERLRGHPYDARADLYAVGVILHEMLAGARPFIGNSPEAIMEQVLHRPPRPLRACRPDVSRALDAVVRRALAKDPERRFADAEEMLAALEDVPVREELAVRVTSARVEQATTGRIVELAPSRWGRLWAWLRFGRWRWREATR